MNAKLLVFCLLTATSLTACGISGGKSELVPGAKFELSETSRKKLESAVCEPKETSIGCSIRFPSETASKAEVVESVKLIETQSQLLREVKEEIATQLGASRFTPASTERAQWLLKAIDGQLANYDAGLKSLNEKLKAAQ